MLIVIMMMIASYTNDACCHHDFVPVFHRLGYQIATKHRVPIEILGHAMQAYNKTMYAYGDEAPCYSSPRMLEEALGVDLR